MRVRGITCVAGNLTKSRPLSRYAVGSRPSIWGVSDTSTYRFDVVAEVSLHGRRWLTPSFHVWVNDSGRFRIGFIRREGNVVLKDSFFLMCFLEAGILAPLLGATGNFQVVLE